MKKKKAPIKKKKLRVKKKKETPEQKAIRELFEILVKEGRLEIFL